MPFAWIYACDSSLEPSRHKKNWCEGVFCSCTLRNFSAQKCAFCHHKAVVLRLDFPKTAICAPCAHFVQEFVFTTYVHPQMTILRLQSIKRIIDKIAFTSINIPLAEATATATRPWCGKIYLLLHKKWEIRNKPELYQLANRTTAQDNEFFLNFLLESLCTFYYY